MTLLSLQGADLGYGNDPILQEVTFKVREHDWHIIHGANGTGKSTLLRSLVGSLPTLQGQRQPQKGLRLAFLPQAIALDPIFPVTVIDVAKMGLWYGPKLNQKECADDLALVLSHLEEVEMEAHAEVLFSKLSGGQKQRVLLARAMCSQPQVLILDEPTTALDTKSRALYYQSLTNLRATGAALVIATHEHEGWPSDSIHWVARNGKFENE
ncbi:MAG: metal ABC transporter ATP-binding protein [Planctomycetes bacterium]|nr:metal ABC transporter ATP-binding protein [Planctomycetota bacterium]